jgi:hypothetical protein
MKHEAFPARIRMNQSEFLSIIILECPLLQRTYMASGDIRFYMR